MLFWLDGVGCIHLMAQTSQEGFMMHRVSTSCGWPLFGAEAGGVSFLINLLEI